MVPCSSSTSMDDQHTTSSTSFNSPDTLSFNTKNTPPPVSMLGEKLEEEGEDTSSVSELEVTRSSSITLNSTALSSSTSPPTPTTSMTQWPAPKTLLSTLDLLSPHSRSLVKSSSFTATSMEEGEGASIHSFSFLPPSIEISSPPPHQHSCIDTFDFPFPKLVSSSSRPSVPSLFQLSLQSILVHVPFHPPSWHATTYPWQLSQYLIGYRYNVVLEINSKVLGWSPF
ncbi:hypothetical protein HMI56_003169 [Coelomomyces lativittatus]|nr:hypothetical protein HMI56_003169 [Coelomomyces lativittatus]